MKCTFENCNREVLTKSLCNKHYYFYYNRRKRGIPLDWPKSKRYKKRKIRLCKVDGCTKKHLALDYCTFHYRRNKHGIPLDRPKGVKGELNHNWKDGISQYPDQYEMKKNRKIKFEQENGKCEVCNRKAVQVHHLDNLKKDHSIGNLKLLCIKCHRRFHRGRKKKTSIWIRRYGMNSKDLGKALRCSYGTLVKWHKSGDIAFFLGK